MKRRRIATDLTALLDVIMIVLFWALTSANEAATSAQQEASDIVSVAEETQQLAEQKLEEAEQKIEEANEKEALAEDAYKEATRLENTYSVIGDISYIISISVEQNGENRDLIVSCDNSAEERISFNWDSLDYAKDVLTAFLDKKAKPSENESVIFVVFQYDEKDIYNKDYNLVKSVVADFASTHSNVFVAENVIVY